MYGVTKNIFLKVLFRVTKNITLRSHPHSGKVNIEKDYTLHIPTEKLTGHSGLLRLT